MENPNGPYETEQHARSAARAAIPPEAGHHILSAAQARRLLRLALESAGVTAGAYDDRVAEWLGGWGEATAAVVAGWVTRAAAGKPGPHAVTFDLTADDSGATYFVLSEALRSWAEAQRDRAEAEGGNDQRDAWASVAEGLLGAVEAALDGNGR